MSKVEVAEEVMEALRECLLALQLAETRKERDLIRSQIHTLKMRASELVLS